MKKYIQPRTKQMVARITPLMLVVSDKVGYGGPMSNEGTFEDDAMPKAKSVWE